ncbi:MAG: hypothetical protein J6S85_16435 [Methanobrevibacter sp.]|nr:hypothetical protein [Methanobrevibacter sp.]
MKKFFIGMGILIFAVALTLVALLQKWINSTNMAFWLFSFMALAFVSWWLIEDALWEN